ncbi:MAG: NUDIX domain-containing protein [Planctomycetota bacterium]|nr:MAG: NUDIX domain-containing protein [Planctomycetota bacterium]
MHRRKLIRLLESHRPFDAHESRCLERILRFVRATPACFERSCREGHVTGSAWLIHPDGERVLLTHHRKLGGWLQPGGHADGDPDVLAVALREAREESGLSDIRPLSESIFDVDVHAIAARAGEPAHLHYDVRFLLQAGDDRIRIGEESLDLRWFTPEELDRLEVDDSVRRMRRKWRSTPRPIPFVR